MKDKRQVESLLALPNIGNEMARCLVAAGIESPAELRRLGSVEAAVRVSPHRRSGPVCRSALSGLEGAIRGVRWHSIPTEEREALWKEYEARAMGSDPDSGRPE